MDFVQDITPVNLSSTAAAALAGANAAHVARASGDGAGDASGAARKSGRARKISAALRRVDALTREEVAAARLDAFECDDPREGGARGGGASRGEGDGSEGSDEEFVFNEFARDGEAQVQKAGPGQKGKKRTTRGAVETRKAMAARTFHAMLERSGAERVPSGVPTYLTQAAGPSRTSAARKFCSVCGFVAPYGCARCGMRFCSKKCAGVHAETRCLKMVG